MKKKRKRAELQERPPHRASAKHQRAEEVAAIRALQAQERLYLNQSPDYENAAPRSRGRGPIERLFDPIE
jgi:hypothetical protein